jgi:uroporphyrin-III C-methyltransferase/precorrin-2 dehydrogenase/sirohydrochlorin ferrochelatase
MTAPRLPADLQPPRMDTLARLPIFLALDGKRAVMAGGNAAAVWKAELLSAAGANVEVFAAAPVDELVGLAENPPRGTVTIHRRDITADDFAGTAIAVGAFADDGDAAQFAATARARGVPVNVIDKPAFCDFAFGAIVNRSPLVIGISTDGAAPVFGMAVRAKIEVDDPARFCALGGGGAAMARRAVRDRAFPSGLPAVLADFARHAAVHPDREPTQSDFDGFPGRNHGQSHQLLTTDR